MSSCQIAGAWLPADLGMPTPPIASDKPAWGLRANKTKVKKEMIDLSNSRMESHAGTVAGLFRKSRLGRVRILAIRAGELFERLLRIYSH